MAAEMTNGTSVLFVVFIFNSKESCNSVYCPGNAKYAKENHIDEQLEDFSLEYTEKYFEVVIVHH